MNIYEKLNAIRKGFLDASMKKSGKNMHAQFTYFQLEDIIPIAQKLFDKHKVSFITTYSPSLGVMTGKLVDLESDGEIVITIPFREISTPEKFRMNEVQSLGASLTYSRRYLYFTLFDIVEADIIDDDKTAKAMNKVEVPKTTPAETVTPVKPVKPKTATERKEIAKEITKADENADELMLEALKTACTELLKIKPDTKEIITAIALKTKKFTECKKSDCEAIIREVGNKIEDAKRVNA